MDWTPLVVFLAFGLAQTVLQAIYFRELAKCGGGVRTDGSVSQEIIDRPNRLIPIVARETATRLRALLRRNPENRLEILRLVTCAVIVMTFATFLWTFYAFA